MILPRFEYKKARSIAEAIDVYKDFNGSAQYLAGGTDLIPIIKLRLSTPAAVIDLKHINELKTISREGRSLIIGANVTLFELKSNPMIKEYFPCLFESLEATSCETLQMRGTIGGNILQNTRCLQYNKSLDWRKARGLCYKMGGKTCNVVANAKTCFSNYCSDNAPSLIVLGAQVKLSGPEGTRVIKLEKLFSGNGKMPFNIKPGEILTQINLPLKKTKGAYEKLRVRDSMDYPLVGVAVSIESSKARACVVGIGPAPRIYEIKDVNGKTIKTTADKAYEDAKPVLNATLSPLYRKRMVGVLLKRAFKKLEQGGAR